MVADISSRSLDLEFRGLGTRSHSVDWPLLAITHNPAQMYVDMFSRSLDLEYRGSGISVQNQAPGFVATKLSKIRKPTIDAPTPDVWAAAAIRHIGYESTSSPYWRAPGPPTCMMRCGTWRGCNLLVCQHGSK